MTPQTGTKKALEHAVTEVKSCNSCHIYSVPCPICLPERQIKSEITDYDRGTGAGNLLVYRGNDQELIDRIALQQSRLFSCDDSLLTSRALLRNAS
jgi:hypothetical protein